MDGIWRRRPLDEQAAAWVPVDHGMRMAMDHAVTGTAAGVGRVFAHPRDRRVRCVPRHRHADPIPAGAMLSG